MWNNQKKKSQAFIHNDDTKCFHMVVQRTQKVVMMGHINFKGQTLIKRWWVGKKMNAMGRKFKDEINRITIKSCFRVLLEVVNVFEVLKFI
jgi:hypothetical protein